MPGIYWILTTLPIWATAFLLYVATLGVLFILRDRCEGLYYQTSYSAQLGDGGLIVIVLMVADILKRGMSLPAWLQSNAYQFAAIIVGVALGAVWFYLESPKQWGDRYHHFVIAPLLCYLVITLVPIICLHGSGFEMVSTVFLITLWAALCVYDSKTRRLNQREYLRGRVFLGKIWLNMTMEKSD